MSKEEEELNTFTDVFKNSCYSRRLSGEMLKTITRKKVFKKVKNIIEKWLDRKKCTEEDWYTYFFMKTVYGILFKGECVGCEGPSAWRFAIPSNKDGSAEDYVKALILAAKRDYKFTREHDYLCSDLVGQKADSAFELFVDLHEGFIPNSSRASLNSVEL